MFRTRYNWKVVGTEVIAKATPNSMACIVCKCPTAELAQYIADMHERTNTPLTNEELGAISDSVAKSYELDNLRGYIQQGGS